MGRDAKNLNINMLIFIAGEETFQAQQKLIALREHFLNKFDPSGLNLAEFQDQFEIGEVSQALGSAPFLSEKRMVILRGLVGSLKKGEVDFWARVFRACPDSTIIIFFDEEEIIKQPLYLALKDESETRAYFFETLSGATLNNFILQQVKAAGGTIESSALAALGARVGSNLWQISNEIGKLIAYAGGRPINQQFIEEIVQANFEERIFDLMDAISGKNIRQALVLLRRERARGTEDSYVFNMLIRQARILLAVCDELSRDPNADKASIAAKLKLHPFVAQKSLSQARKFSRDELIYAMEKFFDLDRSIKIGELSGPEAVDLAIMNLASTS